MFAQESVMDIQKEKEAFEDCYKTSRDYKFYVKHEMSEKQIFEFKNDKYVVDCVNDGWKIWRAAKAQAVPEWFEIGRLQDRITELLDERQELYAQLDAGSTEGFILVEKDLVQSIHQSCVKCLDIDLPPIFRATVCTIRDEVAPLIEAQEPTND